ncbi:MAG: helix-turn-helix transcriptional regulator [Rhodobacteraceae bacterium]|nr:helix-turn-helix transcriptional regulator [Paracoccaceae bacterium]
MTTFSPDAVLISTTAYLEKLGNAAGIALSLFVIVGLTLRLIETKGPRMHLWAMVVFFAVSALDMLADTVFHAPFSVLLALYDWELVLFPGYTVGLYFFVRGLTSPEPKVTGKDLVHLIPFAMALLCLLPELVLPGPVRKGLEDQDLSSWHQYLIDLGRITFLVLWIVVLTIYGSLCVRRLVLHKRNIRELFSDLSGKKLIWLDALVATIFILAGTVILGEVLLLLGFPGLPKGMFTMAFDVLLTAAFGLFALRASPSLPSWSESIVTSSPAPALGATEGNQPQNQRYARSGLQADDLARYADRLEKRMAQGELWRDSSLNLRGLSAAVSLPPIHLSEVLNTRLSLTFYDFVNQHRVKDACALLSASNQTVLEISEMVGFNSKSTFNASFKKVTGQTPTEYRSTSR